MSQQVKIKSACGITGRMNSEHSTVARRRRAVKAAVVLAVVGGGLVLVSPVLATPSDYLDSGQDLTAGQALWSRDGRFSLQMQADGNVTLRAPGNQPLWASGTDAAANHNSILRLQPDGNLVVIAPGNRPVWATGTSARQNEGAVLRVQNDANVVLLAPGNRPIWATGTVQGDTPPGGSGLRYPLACRGQLIGYPYSGTHRLGNWESDNAIDIKAPVGTAVYAIGDGVIGSQIGALNSKDPRMQGLRVHLATAKNEYYYAHLSKLVVVAGEHVRAGQLLGYSGSANRTAHLHLASKNGDPRDTVSDPPVRPC